MCEWLSSPSAFHFHAKTGSSPISIQSSNLTRSIMMHEHDYPTPPPSFLTSPQPPPPTLSSSTSSSSTASSISPSSSPRKGSIAFTLNSIGELQKLDQEEWSTNYQTHFTTDYVTTPMMMDDDEDEEEEGLCSFPSPSFTDNQAGFTFQTPTSPSTTKNAPGQFTYPHNKKGLRLFSQHVCDILQLHGRATYNQLVQQLIEELNQPVCELSTSPPKSTAAKKKCDPKNIRRRVYDALNVLMAINFITKDKKEIRWIGSTYYHNQQQNESHSADPIFDQDDISYYHTYMNNASDSYDEDNNNDYDNDDYSPMQEDCHYDTDTMMVVEKDIQREEQRYQDLLQRIDLKRREIQNQIEQKYGPGCQHGLPDPLSFAT